jgi:hypothetical protein
MKTVLDLCIALVVGILAYFALKAQWLWIGNTLGLITMIFVVVAALHAYCDLRYPESE